MLVLTLVGLEVVDDLGGRLVVTFVQSSSEDPLMDDMGLGAAFAA